MTERMQSKTPWRLVVAVAAVVSIAFAFCLPRPLFDKPYSRVLQDRKGELLGARIAADGQWRFPPPDSLPPRFVQALIAFEDKHFFRHHGLDPGAAARALVQNLRAGRIKSGASTLSMQLMRLAGDNPRRTIWNKALECMQAVRLELTHSKADILRLYATHAPFGGNTVGLEAATWRYFGKPPHLLSWAEAATLAVLPNQPGLIHPGRNTEQLKAKRDRLLRRLGRRELLDSLALALALEEPLPGRPMPFPNWAPHFLEFAFSQAEAPYNRMVSSLDGLLQQQLVQLADRYHEQLAGNQIHNLAVLVLHLPTRSVRAYLGNARGAGTAHEGAVDMVQAERSTGSILKPFLYAFALHDGQLLPPALLPDIPLIMGGFRPENYNRSYDGAVAARQALQRSLNIPFVDLLNRYGLEKFHYRLEQLGLRSLHFPPEHYGLTLILGGAEATLWDLSRAYAGLGKTLLDFAEYDSRYTSRAFQYRNWNLAEPEASEPDRLDQPPLLQASACWFTLEAMRNLERPTSADAWQRFSSSRQLAWKTGTSFGFRDAWAIGMTPDYVIGIWVGNADGEGRPGLVGIQAAAPLLFEVLQLLPASQSWFLPPYDDMIRMRYCKASGWRALPICPQADTAWMPRAGLRAPACPYHRLIHLDSTGRWQVHTHCAPGGMVQDSVLLTLPPAMGHFFSRVQPDYAALPPLHPDCAGGEHRNPMQLIYPRRHARIYLPVDLQGQPAKTIFEAAHDRENALVHWHLDEDYLGTTQRVHTMELAPDPGLHLLTLVDESGNRLEQTFELIARRTER